MQGSDRSKEMSPQPPLLKPKTSVPRLSFKPINEGLGFHPFSDGLPYAPVAKTTRNSTATQMPQHPRHVVGPVGNLSEPEVHVQPPQRPPQFTRGSGAVAAGFPRAVLNPPKVRASADIFQALPTSFSKSVPNQVVAEQPVAQTQRVFGWAYVFKRIAAFLVDGVSTLAIAVAVLGGWLIQSQMPTSKLMSPSIMALAVAALILLQWLILTLEEVIFKSTLGKSIFGLSLQGTRAAIFLRAFFFLPSLGFLGAGVLWAAFDQRKRCWHDLVVDLQPIESNRR